MSNGRETMLASVRKQRLEPLDLPSDTANWTTYDDPCGQFIQMLEAVGGQARIVDDELQLAAEIAELAAYRNADRRCCEVPLPEGTRALTWNVKLDQVDDPHDLATLDFAILPGLLAVAENGAVWVTDHHVRHRAVYFIPQHLALVIPQDRILNNLHEAYCEFTFHDNRFGCFISGPSKTADIEQSLVIGAHGARSLTVFVVRTETTRRSS